jgi:hypothetical protein
MRALALLVAGSLAGSVAAQTTQRCEGPDGKVTYSNTVCPPGTSGVRTLEAAPPPATDDAKAARERARRDQQTVDDLARKQKAEDAQAAKARAAASKKAEQTERECRKLAARADTLAGQVERAPLNRRASAEQAAQKAREQVDARCRAG